MLEMWIGFEWIRLIIQEPHRRPSAKNGNRVESLLCQGAIRSLQQSVEMISVEFREHGVDQSCDSDNARDYIWFVNKSSIKHRAGELRLQLSTNRQCSRISFMRNAKNGLKTRIKVSLIVARSSGKNSSVTAFLF